MRSTSELETFWPEADWETSGGREERPFLQAPASKRDVAPRDLTVAVNGAKKISDLGLFGGAFLINEFGNVLVPSQDDSRVLHVGDWKGPVWVESPYDRDTPVPLYDGNWMAPGYD